VIRKIKDNHGGLKLNGTHQLLVCADDVNLLGDNIDTLAECLKARIVDSIRRSHFLGSRLKQQRLSLYNSWVYLLVQYWDFCGNGYASGHCIRKQENEGFKKVFSLQLAKNS
jgi:hypothetical protein